MAWPSFIDGPQPLTMAQIYTTSVQKNGAPFGSLRLPSQSNPLMFEVAKIQSPRCKSEYPRANVSSGSSKYSAQPSAQLSMQHAVHLKHIRVIIAGWANSDEPVAVLEGAS